MTSQSFADEGMEKYAVADCDPVEKKAAEIMKTANISMSEARAVASSLKDADK